MTKYLEIYDANFIKNNVNKNYVAYSLNKTKNVDILTPNEMLKRLLNEVPTFKKYVFKTDSNRLLVSDKVSKSDLKRMRDLTDTIAYDLI